jgi:malate dehydrogenase (oxaloacetate-decarboxylating)(NADP+)
MSGKISFSKRDVLEYHLGGKIGISLKKALNDQKDLSMAYTPGVSEVCKEISNDAELVYDYTARGNTVGVITDGTAVLGLGDIGAKASLPVMEGKAVLFKAFAGVDAWPVAVENVKNDDGTTDVSRFIDMIASISCNFGGINLEDIASPYCFRIEDELDRTLDIPVFHDDQWGTAIITLAAFKNYCILTDKKPEETVIVINGAGAAGLRIAEMIKTEKVKECILCDSKGVISTERRDLNEFKKAHAVETDKKDLKEAMRGADVFIGVSVADCVEGEMVSSMAEYPGIFAMANPVPEILPEVVAEYMKNRKYIMATGRSDYPNQINNVLGFPFIFRGALDVRARSITMAMKIAASEALAKGAREKNVPEEVKRAYGRDFEFGPDYIIPTPFDPRIKGWEATAVAEAAINEKVARKTSIPRYCN